MNYKYRVTLKGIKGFFRVYSVPAEVSLYKFHKQLQSDLEFAPDQPILFKALAEDGAVVARYALIDLGKGTVDQIPVRKTVADGIVSFEYFYDTASKKSVIITFEGEFNPCSGNIVLLESKGPLPIDFENGYVAFEDLPVEHRNLHPSAEEEDDDDDDDAGEDPDKEEEEQVYDENE